MRKFTQFLRQNGFLIKTNTNTTTTTSDLPSPIFHLRSSTSHLLRLPVDCRRKLRLLLETHLPPPIFSLVGPPACFARRASLIPILPHRPSLIPILPHRPSHPFRVFRAFRCYHPICFAFQSFRLPVDCCRTPRSLLETDLLIPS